MGFTGTLQGNSSVEKKRGGEKTGKHTNIDNNLLKVFRAAIL